MRDLPHSGQPEPGECAALAAPDTPKIAQVLATVQWPARHIESLRDALRPASLIVCRPDQVAEIAAALAHCDVAILSGDFDDKFMSAPHLRWIHCDHAGLNQSARPWVFEKGLVVTGSAGRSSPVLAEHAIFFMLALAYQFPAFYQAQREHRWGIPGQDRLRGLFGRTVGIMGLGHIGMELAARAKAFGMRVLAYRRGRAAKPPCIDALYSADAGDGFESLLRESDFVVLAMPLNDETWHLIGASEFSVMKPSAFLVNMARGQLVDEEALIGALRSGAIAGAGLDCTAIEPLPVTSPLWDLPNVLITPHTTPQVADRDQRSLEIVLENVRRYRSGELLLNQLTARDVFTKS